MARNRSGSTGSSWCWRAWKSGWGANPSLAGAREGLNQSDAAGLLEGADAGLEVEAAVVGVVLGGEPEGAAVDRVDAHRRIVAPPVAGALLEAAAVDQDLLGAHGAQRVARGAGGIADARVGGRAGNAVADGDVALLVLRDAGQPAVHGGIRREGAGLVQHPAAAVVADLGPAHACQALGVHVHRVADHDRLVRAEVAIHGPEHGELAHGVELLAR